VVLYGQFVLLFEIIPSVDSTSGTVAHIYNTYSTGCPLDSPNLIAKS